MRKQAEGKHAGGSSRPRHTHTTAHGKRHYLPVEVVVVVDDEGHAAADAPAGVLLRQS